MKIERKTLLRGSAYIAFGISSLFLSLYLTFPTDALGQRVAHEIQKASKGKFNVSFGEFSFYRLSGVQAEQVELRQSKAGGDVKLVLDSVKARVNLLPLLLLKKSLSAYIDLGGGELSADIDLDGRDVDLAISSENIALEKIPLLKEYAGMPMRGNLSGKVDMAWRQNITKSTANIELALNKMMLGEASISGFSIPALTLGNLETKMNIEKGKFSVQSFKQTGGDISARLHANSDLRPSIMASSMDVCAEFKFEDSVLEKNPKLKTALQLAEVQLKKDKESYLHAAFRGTFSRPRLRRQVLCSDAKKSKKSKKK